jgi:ribosomal protein L11 methyltransferase
MKLVEAKIIFDAEDIKKAQDEIANQFYEFGVQGLKIEEPTEQNALDYYKDEKQFLTKDYAISAYFPDNIYADKKKQLFRDTFHEKFNSREDIVYTLDFYELDDEDYQNSWKKYLHPEKVGERFVVKPTWRDYEAEQGEIVIELDPGRAFGTGSHPTTSLCMRMMEKYVQQSESLIDVGTGSGILMVAAEKLGVEEIWGVDIDEMAVEVAIENLELNRVNMEKVKVLKGDLVKVVDGKKFDVLVANILADVILILLDDVAKVVKNGGLAIFSGIIEDKRWLVEKKIEELGFDIIDVMQEGEWCSLTVRV